MISPCETTAFFRSYCMPCMLMISNDHVLSGASGSFLPILGLELKM